MPYAVVRIRSGINAVAGVKETLMMMNLNRINHCVVIPNNPSYKGMLQKTKDYITWGEITPETMARLIVLNGQLEGGVKLTDAYIKKHTKYTSILGLAKAICKDEFTYKDIDGIKPLFRLPPPRKGYEGVKKQYNPRHPTRGGSLGYRGDTINDLIGRMLPPPKKVPAKAPAKKVLVKKTAETKKAVPKKTAAKKTPTKKEE